MVVIVALALLQNGILLAAVIAAGLVLSDRVGLRIPLINGWAKGDRSLKPKSVLVPGVRMGAAVGVALVGIEAVFFLRHLPSAMLLMFEIALWKRLLGSLLYGGITEELLMRLFLLSLVAWLFGRWWKTAAGMPAPGAFRAAIVVVAVLFGLGHLPATAAIAALDARARRARAGSQWSGWSRVWLSVLETRPGSGDGRTYERARGDADPGSDAAESAAMTRVRLPVWSCV